MMRQATKHSSASESGVEANTTWTNRGGGPPRRPVGSALALNQGEQPWGRLLAWMSLKETAVCIVGDDGARLFEGKFATDPAGLSRLLRKRAPDLVRVGLESGATSAWLTRALTAEGLPVVCLDARHAQAVLSMRPSKSDHADARGRN